MKDEFGAYITIGGINLNNMIPVMILLFNQLILQYRVVTIRNRETIKKVD